MWGELMPRPADGGWGYLGQEESEKADVLLAPLDIAIFFHAWS